MRLPSPDRRAAAIALACTAGVAVVLLTVAAYVAAVRSEGGLQAAYAEVLLVVYGMLTGIAAGYLSKARK